MAAPNPDETLLEILALSDTANRIARALGGDNCVIFQHPLLDLPRLRPPEMGFLKCVSWLFVLYHEAGNIGVRFLLLHGGNTGPEGTKPNEEHYELVRDLRTYFQHRLFEHLEHDRRVREHCEGWLRLRCGSVAPGNESDWVTCRDTILAEALAFMGAVVHTVRSIEMDESATIIISELRARIERHHPPHEFDRIIEEVKTDVGRDYLDATAFRKRHYDRWNKNLMDLRDGYDFDIEARKLVEYSLLTDVLAVLPVTGRDLMERFGIAPGPKVGELLGEAKRLYEQEPCSQDKLLDRLAKIQEGAPITK